MESNRIAELAESISRNNRLTEAEWDKLRGNGSNPLPSKTLRRYCAGLRLLAWLQQKIREIT